MWLSDLRDLNTAHENQTVSIKYAWPMHTPDFCKAALKMLPSFLCHGEKAKDSESVAGAQSQWPSKWRGLKSVSELLSALSCPIFFQLHNTWLLIFSAAYFIRIDLRWTMMNVFTATGLSWGRCNQDAYSTFVTFGVSLMEGDLMFSCLLVQFWWLIWGLIKLIVFESLEDYVWWIFFTVSNVDLQV